MRQWSAAQVAELDDLNASYTPGLTRIETPEYLLFVVPGTQTPNCVRRFQVAEGNAEHAMDEILERVRELGGTGMRWVVNSRTVPVDMADRLRRRGFELSAAAEILYHDLGTRAAPNLPPARTSSAIAVREAVTDAEIDAFVSLGQNVFDEPPPPSKFLEDLRTQTRQAVAATGHSPLFIALNGATPIGRAGLTVTGLVGHLWTAGVLADHRGKGAYQLLTRERCRVAADQGAELAITHAVTETSGHILRRHGFQSAGPYDYYQVHWTVEAR
jgi:hypothetical protein